jgi:hypothetical protein
MLTFSYIPLPLEVTTVNVSELQQVVMVLYSPSSKIVITRGTTWYRYTNNSGFPNVENLNEPVLNRSSSGFPPVASLSNYLGVKDWHRNGEVVAPFCLSCYRSLSNCLCKATLAQERSSLLYLLLSVYSIWMRQRRFVTG